MFDNTSSTMRFGNFVTIYFSSNMIAIYVTMALIGIVGNVVTCIVIVSNRNMHTATNCYLFNLAVSDLLILIWGVPVYNALSYYSDFVCRSRIVIAETAVYVTILTLSVFTVERYLAICKPFFASKHQISSPSRAMKFIPVMWLIGFLFAFPLSLQFGVVHHVDDPNRTACTFIKETGIYLVEVISFSFFVIPMLLICILYVLIGLAIRKSAKHIRSNQNDNTDRSKQRAPKMLIAIVVAFIVCWAPAHVVRVLSTLSAFNIFSGILEKIMQFYLFDLSQLLYYSSCLVNPIIYNIMSKKYRDAFKNTLLRCKINGFLNNSSSEKSGEKADHGTKANANVKESKL